ncbi:AAA family ATPase [Candidatus Mycosynbacter amalyticus]|uniref:DNA 3'-5' helicase n=1 Tax=Candidatus Mycosynbacter amalyticus TaxID=2665156 RepID=A0A857MJJ2_9BACT|nr:ATP-dependent DNA helicase [Candidatus Mycosynbacter amalyticus]QHN42736.1 AAA family ATPase [Candidatus Mycosynbacter amalyticus]
MDFDARYKNLNAAQKQAVDTIDGPVMVVAGPGTGKTELLSMRAANILRKTDELPENILCLTFTESGSVAMQKRLTSIIGRDAYNVSIYTFHAFGTEIMSRYREYFYRGAEFRPADTLSVHRIITSILDTLPYNNPLTSKMNGQYTAIGDIIKAISDLKRASLTDAEFAKLLDATDEALEIASALVADAFTDRISKATRDKLANIIPKIADIGEAMPLDTLQPLSGILASSLQRALDDADAHPKITPPLTAWKREWMTVSADKKPILKATKYQPKLRALSQIYSQYLAIMQAAELIDFDDMIMQVVHAIEVNPELRYELQEKYHYIMVDEFQDTNLAQMRILRNLTNNPIVEDSPNILVVGDDDQAIYGFQGAEVGNIIKFSQLYPTTTQITLRDNYRSVAPVLAAAREVIVQASERLETTIAGLDKTLTPHTETDAAFVEIVELATPDAERGQIAHEIKQLLAGGAAPESIAVIARQHKDLVALLGYLSEKDIPVSYDRRDNVLDDEAVRQLEHIGLIVVALARGDHAEANALLPELLSHPAWRVAPETLWEISVKASNTHQSWLETMRHHEHMHPFWVWLQSCAKESEHMPLERMVDVLLGTTKLETEYVSPLRDYFFPVAEFEQDASRYIMHLENLTAIRARLREHEIDMTSPRLADFLGFIQQNRDTDTHITSLRHVGQDADAVRLLSAHSSKGLEFDHVFIVNATDAMWGEKARGRADTIMYPPNLRLSRNAGNYDERLRLFYVAMTRARYTLRISYARENDSAKEMLQAGFLLDNSIPSRSIDDPHAHSSHLEAATQAWYAPLVSIPTSSMREYLAPLLFRYKLSATHINTFIDVSQGGPQTFLLGNLLRFPQSPSPYANYGTAIHATLQRAHDYLRAHKSPQPEEDIIHEFGKSLERMQFTDEEHALYLQKGGDALRTFLRAKYATFSPEQQAELNFNHQDVWLDDVHLTGKLDVVQFDRDAMTATVTDYKTGGVLTSWDKGADYQKMKAHKYRQQLLFYKLLIEHSREWQRYTMARGVLQFVEPNPAGEIVALELTDIDPSELERFTQLIRGVWRHIQDLSFPDTSAYEQSIEGIHQFEQDLIDGKI